MEIKINLNEMQIFDKVTNDQLGLFISQTWKKLIDPYTPRKTGRLMGITGNLVAISPWELHYKVEYASTVYFNKKGVVFVTQGTGRNPFATDHWDIKAEQAGKKNELIKLVNEHIRNGKI